MQAQAAKLVLRYVTLERSYLCYEVCKFQENITNSPSNSETCNLKFAVIFLAQMFLLEEE